MFWELSKIKDNAEVAGPLEPQEQLKPNGLLPEMPLKSSQVVPKSAVCLHIKQQYYFTSFFPHFLEQMLVDCGAGDCNGGWADRAFDTIINKGGDCREDDYPYTAHNGNFFKIIL